MYLSSCLQESFFDKSFKMVFAWFVVFITVLVSTRVSNKLKRAKTTQDEAKCIPLNDSETESEDWEKTVEGAKEAAALVAKGSPGTKGKGPASAKAKTPPTAAEKGKAPMKSIPMKKKGVARKWTRTRGISI